MQKLYCTDTYTKHGDNRIVEACHSSNRAGESVGDVYCKTNEARIQQMHTHSVSQCFLNDIAALRHWKFDILSPRAIATHTRPAGTVKFLLQETPRLIDS